MTALLEQSCRLSSPLSVLGVFLSSPGMACEWFPPMVDTLSVRQHLLASCTASANMTLSARSAACSLRAARLRRIKVELTMYFWTVVKHSYSKQHPPPERHYHSDVAHLKSEAFSVFPVWMDSDLPDELFRAAETQEAGETTWPMCASALRQIDQPVAVPQWGYLYRMEENNWPDPTCVALISSKLPWTHLTPPPPAAPPDKKFNARAETRRWLWTFSLDFHTQTGQSWAQHSSPWASSFTGLVKEPSWLRYLLSVSDLSGLVHVTPHQCFRRISRTVNNPVLVCSCVLLH